MACSNIFCILITLDTFHVEMLPSKALVLQNMEHTSFTLPTSHAERSRLNAAAPANM